MSPFQANWRGGKDRGWRELRRWFAWYPVAIPGWWAGYDPFFVAWDRALPFSPDGRYHICISYEGEGVIPKVQCFIVPPSAV